MMQKNPPDYGIFLEFMEIFSKDGFIGIDRDHPLVIELEEMMALYDQFFYVADIMQMKILFVSKGSTRMIGIEPHELNLNQFMEVTHPDEIPRLSLGRPLIIKLGQDLYQAEKGSRFISTDFRMRNPSGDYAKILVQGILDYKAIPRKMVFFLKLHTNIDWHQRTRQGLHYYLGEDQSNFRYPDLELLELGILLSEREFQIIKLIAEGLNSEQIAGKLFLSVNTVHTHRSNMLKKTGKESTADLILNLKERGLL